MAGLGATSTPKWVQLVAMKWMIIWAQGRNHYWLLQIPRCALSGCRGSMLPTQTPWATIQGPGRAEDRGSGLGLVEAGGDGRSPKRMLLPHY